MESGTPTNRQKSFESEDCGASPWFVTRRLSTRQIGLVLSGIDEELHQAWLSVMVRFLFYRFGNKNKVTKVGFKYRHVADLFLLVLAEFEDFCSSDLEHRDPRPKKYSALALRLINLHKSILELDEDEVIAHPLKMEAINRLSEVLLFRDFSLVTDELKHSEKLRMIRQTIDRRVARSRGYLASKGACGVELNLNNYLLRLYSQKYAQRLGLSYSAQVMCDVAKYSQKFFPNSSIQIPLHRDLAQHHKRMLKAAGESPRPVKQVSRISSGFWPYPSEAIAFPAL